MSGRPVTAGDRWQRRAERHMLDRAAWVVSPSQAMLRAVEAERGRPFRRASVIPYPLDPRLLTGCRDDRRSPGPCRVLFAARNDPVKGGPVLLQAALRLGSRPAAVAYDFYGYEPSRAEVDAVRQAGMADQIRFHPFVPKEELLQQYYAADICVVPSYWDNSPNTVYEAMAAGVAVIASRVGGIPELVVHEETGLLVPPGDPAALAGALARLLADAGARQRLGANGRARIAHLADIQDNTDRRLAVYHAVMGD